MLRYRTPAGIREEVLVVVINPLRGFQNKTKVKIDDLYNIGPDITHFFGSIWRSKFDVLPAMNLRCEDLMNL